MIYFVGVNLTHLTGGLETAQIKRIKLFKEFNYPAKLIFTAYNPYLQNNLETHGIENYSLNMYDYFQDCSLLRSTVHFDWINYWTYDKQYYVMKSPSNSGVRIFKNGKLIMYSYFHDKERKQLNYIRYFDVNNKPVKTDYYDIRGFLSSSKLLNNEGKLTSQIFYSPNGTPKIEKYFSGDDEVKLTRIILKDENGLPLIFDTEYELIAHFIDSIYKPDDHFILDRPSDLSAAFLNINKNIPVSVFLHVAQHFDINNSQNAHSVVPAYQRVFNNLDKFKSLIVSTVSQKEDIETLINNKIPVYNIPVGLIEPSINYIPYKKNKNKIISVGRYVSSKQQEHQIRLMKKLIADFPNLELHLYGFGPQAVVFSKLSKELGIEKNIFIKGHTSDISEIYNDANLKIFTSASETFALVILESISHGTPVISYDTKYGPSDIITSGINGDIVPLNDEDALYKAVYAYLSDENIQNSYQENSINSISHFEKSHVMHQWKTFLKEMK